MTLCISADGKKSGRNVKPLLIWLCITLFCGLFSFVYESFSHGVFSPFMVWLFLFPLIGGVLPAAAFTVLRCAAVSQWIRRIWRAGVATLTVGSCMTGIFEIYGSDAPLLTWYWYVGFFWILIAAIAYLFSCFQKKTVQT